MSKTFIIKGMPASGKTQLMRNFKNALNVNHKCSYVATETSGRTYTYYTNDNHIYIIGNYEALTGGIDTFSPKSDVILVIEHIKSIDSDARIFCEGCIVKKYDYDYTFFLHVNDDVLKVNMRERRKLLNGKFKKPSDELTDEELEQKIINYSHHERRAVNRGYTILQHSTDDERQHNLNMLVNLANE